MMACNDWIVCCFFLNLSPLHTSFFFFFFLCGTRSIVLFPSERRNKQILVFLVFEVTWKKRVNKRLENNELTFSFWFQTVSAVVNSTRVTQRGQGDLVTITSAVDDGLLFYLFIHFLFLTATFPRPPPPFFPLHCVSSASSSSKCVYVCELFVCLWQVFSPSLFVTLVGSLPSPATVHLTLVTHASTLRVVVVSGTG